MHLVRTESEGDMVRDDGAYATCSCVPYTRNPEGKLVQPTPRHPRWATRQPSAPAKQGPQSVNDLEFGL